MVDHLTGASRFSARPWYRPRITHDPPAPRDSSARAPPLPIDPAREAGDVDDMAAMEAAGDRFRMAVQWHPETRVEIGLMAGLVAAARVHSLR